MKYIQIKIIILILIPMVMCCHKPQPPDDVPFQRYRTDLEFYSNILNTNILYSVYLPDDYNKNTAERYPVVYLLHGLGDTHKSWNDQWLHITTEIDDLESKGLPKMIYIMPQGFRTYYVNRYDGVYNYMDMFIQELLPYMDNTFRSIADKQHRALVGYSMGGFGAMILASKHQEFFSVSMPLSMSFRTDQQYMTEPASGWNEQWGKIFGGYGELGEARLTDYYKQHCPWYMFTNANDFQNMNFYYDCGDDEEQLEIANDRLHVQLRNINLHHEYRVRDGAHTSNYWRNAMTEGLPYISDCFNGLQYADETAFLMPANHSFSKTNTTINNLNVSLYLPQNYSAATEYPLLILAKDEVKCKEDNALSILETATNKKDFIAVCINENEINTADIKNFVATIKSQYLIKNKKPVAISYGNTAEKIYTAANQDSVFSAVFFLDANIGNAAALTNKSVFIYTSITDDGSNYVSANKLYEWSHAITPLYQYRVWNGKDSENSTNMMLDKIKTTILNNL